MNHSELNSQPNDINLSDLISVILNYKKFIFSVCFLGSILVLIYAFTIPNYYQSTSVLEVEKAYSERSSGGSSGLETLTQLTGVSMSGSNNMGNLAEATIRSFDFLNHLILKDETFLPKLLAVKEFDLTTNEIIYDNTIYNPDTRTWVDQPPSYIKAHKIFIKNLSLNISRKSNFATLSYKHISPIIAAEFVDLIYTEANSIIRKRDMDEAEASLAYLYSQLETVNQKEVLASVNALIASELRKLTLANIKKNYLLDPIDRPFIPEQKYSPSRLIILITGFFASLAISIFFITIWHFGIKNKF